MRSSRKQQQQQLMSENIEWVEKIGIVQMGLGIGLEANSLLLLALNHSGTTFISSMYVCMVMVGLCVLACGIVSRTIRVWYTCGTVFACMASNCLCLLALVAPIGFIYTASTAIMLVSHKRLPIAGLIVGSEEYYSLITVSLMQHIVGTILLGLCIVACNFQAQLCRYSLFVNNREFGFFASMFVKFGVGFLNHLPKPNTSQ